MKFAVLFEDQPGTGMDLRLKHMPAHLAFLENHSNIIKAAGPLKSNNGELAGGLWLAEADQVEEVQDLIERDPFWPAGLRKSVKILAWQQVFADGHRLLDL